MNRILVFILSSSLCVLVLPACTPQNNMAGGQEPKGPIATSIVTPEWFQVELTDVQTGETFTMNDYSGKVVLLETMATWCPTCILQASYVYKLHDQLGHPDDLVSISLDVDLNEDADILKEYIGQYGFDWHFAISPLEVDRALGNLYSAQYMNPPLAPMLIIDRQGNVHHLPYGLKDTETLQKAVEPFLTK
jgi:cytochrome oxidase Cu insertion factor (SCO1/SenC/PrrC family)